MSGRYSFDFLFSLLMVKFVRFSHLDLCGSSVSLEAVQEVLTNCPSLNSINLSSCRSLPRGMKRLLQGPAEMKDLREALGVELKVPLVAAGTD